MYPIMLDVEQRHCLVVGGGGVALRKVDGLLSEGARVTVVAKESMPALVELARVGRIQLEERAYEPGEAANYFMVISATNSRSVNRRVFRDAEEAGLWVNVADDPELCSFHLPARVRRGPLQLALGSAGEAPFVVRRLRRLFEGRFGPEWAEWVEAAARFRDAVRSAGLKKAEAEAAYDHFFEATVDAEAWTARVPSEVELAAWIGAPLELNGVRHERPATAGPRTETGRVALVGAGPGDPGLLTLRGRERLLAADAIVYDRLAAAALPCDLRPEIELHCVGKHAGRHPVPQDEISALLVRLAQRGLNVVRFKGGDPFVFGRGSEEAEDLARAGIPFEVVPSVTAGLAATAYAGIPVTHRGQAVRLSIVTAHEATKTNGDQVRWDLMARDPHNTILGYMGVKNLGQVVAQLLKGGMAPTTPAAMICRGTTAAQRVVRASLEDLPDAVLAAALEPPGLFVIGPTVEHAERLDWFTTRALFGVRLLCSGPPPALRAELERAGAELVDVPLPVTPAAHIVMQAVPLTGCLFASAAEVDAFEGERGGPAWSDDLLAWCLNSTSAARARELGWSHVEELERPQDGKSVVAAIARSRELLPA